MSNKQTVRGRTADRGPPAEQAHVVGRIGPKRQKLSNGFLLCRDVPVARTGVMMYRAGETPIKTRDGHPVAYVERNADELFSPQTIGSLITATVTEDHPAVDVTPRNAHSLGKGYCLDARRGEGDDSDVLLADIVVTDPHAIERIENMDKPGGRPVEISLGYDADYIQTAAGEGRQANIVINHIALVERGRCGPRCAIGDSASSDPEPQPTFEKVKTMADKTGAPKQRVKLQEARARVADALAGLDEAEQEDEGAVHVHIHTADTGDGEGGKGRTLDAETETRLATVETGLADIGTTVQEIAASVKKLVEGAPARTADADPDADKGDSKALERSFQEFVSQAEVLVPGYRVPTFDSAAVRKATVDSMCQGRRGVLGAFYATQAGKAVVDGLTGEAALDVEKMGCTEVATVFRAAAALRGQQNNAAATRDSRSVPNAQQHQPAPRIGQPSMTAAQINEANQKFWAGKA